MAFKANATTYALERRDPATGAYHEVAAYTLPKETTFTATVTSPEFLPNGAIPSPGSVAVQARDIFRTMTFAADGTIRAK